MIVRFLAAAGFVLAGVCSSAEACSVVSLAPSDEQWTVEQIIDHLPEVVLEGEIIERDPVARLARLRVDRVWKGEADSVATIEFLNDPDACIFGVPPPEVGTRVRLGLSLVAPGAFLHYGDFDGTLDRLQGTKMDQALREYQRRTAAMKTRADAGGRAEKLAFIDYLRRYHEDDRADRLHEALIRPDLERLIAKALEQGRRSNLDGARTTLGELHRIAPKNEEWKGRIARATFEATGLLSADIWWKDWSDTENLVACQTYLASFDGASFRNARLRDCTFERTRFRGADFRGTDLATSSFVGAVDLKGAQYDCATKLPDDLNPAAAGMINVEGNCPKP